MCAGIFQLLLRRLGGADTNSWDIPQHVLTVDLPADLVGTVRSAI